MCDPARDSGISVDNDDDESQEPMTSQSRQCNDCEKLTYVQRLKKHFEKLACESDNEYHTECNWWLDDNVEEDLDVDNGVRNPVMMRETKEEELDDVEEEVEQKESKRLSKHLSKQSSISSHQSEETDVFETYDNPVIVLTEFSDDNSDTENHNSDDSFESEDDYEPLEIQSRPVSMSSQNSNKLSNIIRELLENEENYVKSLKQGIDIYKSVMDQPKLPITLCGQKFRIFGNIKSLYDFHRTEFLPQLRECQEDVEQIGELFTSYYQRDYFYGYVLYAINRKKSEALCNQHIQFFKKLQDESGDRLGINSFLLQPIQRLPRYQMLLSEIIKELSHSLESVKREIAACCVAEKNIQRLLDTVNESMSINDIRNCYEINLVSQGKFKKMTEFDIYDWQLRRTYRGKVFLFERCLIYTEAFLRENLEYRGHYSNDTLGIIYKEGKSKFKLFAKKRGQQEVEFYADMNAVTEWKNFIHGLLMEFVVKGNVEEILNINIHLTLSNIAEKKRNALNTLQRKPSMAQRQAPTPDSIRSSLISTTSDQSIFSISSSNSSGRESLEKRQSQWYV
ncbi:unnamed protein product [Diamesa hyperborea]